MSAKGKAKEGGCACLGDGGKEGIFIIDFGGYEVTSHETDMASR